MTMTKPTRRLEIKNGDTARFQCVYPSCGGTCCKGSRPPVDPGEVTRIGDNLAKFLPMMRERARRVVETKGFRTNRSKEGRPMLAIAEGYCVFYNDGCVLHKVGAAEGNKNRYKPGTCITFPLDATDDGQWYVRQWGTEGEIWDLPCLNPEASANLAAASLTEEIAFVENAEAGNEAWRD